MAETAKPIVWPSGAWKMLKKIIQAWYTVEESGEEISQKAIAAKAGMQASRLSMNKPFLQAIGVIESEGIGLTEEGKKLGLGLANENELVKERALQSLVKANPLLKHLWITIRARNGLDRAAFEAEVVLFTKQGKGSDYFGTGLNVLEDILLESKLVGPSDDGLHSIAVRFKEEVEKPLKEESLNDQAAKVPVGLRTIPIPVNASTVWYIQISENPNPDESDIERFIEVQKMILGKK